MANEEVKEVLAAVGELREQLEKHGKESLEYKSAVEKTDKVLADQEEKSAKIVADMQQARKEAEELKERMEGLELKLLGKVLLQALTIKSFLSIRL